MTEEERYDRLTEIFSPTFRHQLHELRKTNKRLVHYTTAENAVRIIQNEEVWLRSTRTMNDYSEIQHGYDCMVEALNNEHGSVFRQELDKLLPGVFEEAATQAENWAQTIRLNSYITCLSVHCNDEDEDGRLSMWRAYGGTTSVALVLNNKAFVGSTMELGAFSSGVDYISAPGLTARMRMLGDGLKEHSEFLGSCEKPQLIQALFMMFAATMLCTKHPGFAEELEWRVFHIPGLYGPGRLVRSVECIRGIPQLIYKVPLKNFDGVDPIGNAIPDLLDRVIIGPTEYPWVIREALVALLEDKQVANASDKVWVSGIPLR